MSVRAYRVEEIRFVKDSSFNLWHDDKLIEFLDGECGLFETLPNGSGLTEVPIEVLEKAIKTLNLDGELVKALKQDIEACRDDGYVTYYCF